MGGGDEMRSGIENVLPTCKAVSHRGGQRIIAVFSQSNILEARSELTEKKFNIKLKK